MKLLTDIRILYYTIVYFVQQNFTEWNEAKKCAEFIYRDGWQK